MRATRALVLGVALALCSGGAVEAATPAAAAPKKPARKKRPKSTTAARKKGPPPDVLAEQALHDERLAVLGRMRELNDTLKNAELAARLRRIEDLERQRHNLAMELTQRANGQTGTP